jgi:integrase
MQTQTQTITSLSSFQQGAIARRRGQRTGSLYEASGSWYVRYYDYSKVNADGSPQRPSAYLGPSCGPGALTKRQAGQKAWIDVLEPLHRRTLNPSSATLLSDFIRDKFFVQCVEKKKPSTRKHYGYIIPNFVLPAIGHKRICDVNRDDVEMIVADILNRKHLSTATAHHAKNAISAIFNHAIALGVHKEINPAYKVDCGELVHARRPTFDWERAARVINELPSPYREMAQMSVETSMNAAELCGLCRHHVNLCPQVREIDGEIMAPFTVAVRENWYEGERGSLKTGKRKRNLPISGELARELAALIQASPFQGDEYPVFCSRTGTPIDAHNAANRVFRPLALELGFPVNWHAFRRCHSTFAGQIPGVSLEDRQRTMGHADAAMSLYYSVEDIERRRKIPEKIRERLAERGPRKEPGKVIEIAARSARA